MVTKMKQCGISLLTIAILSGCGLPHMEPSPPPPTLYSLNFSTKQTTPSLLPVMNAPALLVGTSKAAAGFDSPHIMYTRQEHKLDYFAQSRWMAPPSAMLSPLLIDALTRTQAFSAVIPISTTVTTPLRLDTEILRLQHEFTHTPSQVHFALRAYLSDNTTHRVIASHEFDAIIPATSEDTYGGIVAANLAVQHVLEELADFCVKHSKNVKTIHSMK